MTEQTAAAPDGAAPSTLASSSDGVELAKVKAALAEAIETRSAAKEKARALEAEVAQLRPRIDELGKLAVEVEQLRPLAEAGKRAKERTAARLPELEKRLPSAHKNAYEALRSVDDETKLTYLETVLLSAAQAASPIPPGSSPSLTTGPKWRDASDEQRRAAISNVNVPLLDLFKR